MKKIIFILVCATLMACNKSENKETSQTVASTVLWAKTVQTNLPMQQDTMWSKEEWDNAYQLDKAAIFNSVKSAVLAGKMKVYGWYPEAEMTIAEFNAMLVRWDTNAVAEDPNNPGTIITAPIKKELTADDISEIRFNESIEFDSINGTLHKIVNVAQFLGYKLNEVGEIMGKKKLFDVKFNDGATAGNSK